MATQNGQGRADRKTAPVDKLKDQVSSPPAAVRRPCKEHSFLTDVADVRVMEQGLLQLLEDFHSGKLQAFGNDLPTGASFDGGSEMFEKMDEIRTKQEQLAHLHFELDLQQDMRRMDTEEARTRNNENISKMIDKLHDLSSSIQQVQRNPSYEHPANKQRDSS